MKEHTINLSENPNNNKNESTDTDNELKLMIDHIDSTLNTQNKKLDVVIEKLEDHHTCADKLRKQPVKILQKTVDKEDSSMQTESCDSDESDNTENYLKKIQVLELEIKKLNEQNKILENEIQQHEQLASEPSPIQRKSSSGILVTAIGVPPTEFEKVKDSILQVYKKENRELKELLIIAASELEDMLKISPTNSNETTIQGKSITFSYIATSAKRKAVKTILSGRNLIEGEDAQNPMESENETELPASRTISRTTQQTQTEEDTNDDDTSVQKIEEMKRQNQILERKLAEVVKEQNNEMKSQTHEKRVSEMQRLRNRNIQLESQIKIDSLENQLELDISKLENKLEEEKSTALERIKLQEINQNAIDGSQQMECQCKDLKSIVNKLEADLEESRRKEQSADDRERMKTEIEKLRIANNEKENNLLETTAMLKKRESEIIKLNALLEKERQDAARQTLEFKGIYRDFEETAYKEEKRLKRELLTKDEEIKLLTQKIKALEEQFAAMRKEVKHVCTDTSEALNQPDKKEYEEMQHFTETLFQENQDLRNILNKLINNLEAKLNNLIRQNQSLSKIGESNEQPTAHGCKACNIPGACANPLPKKDDREITAPSKTQSSKCSAKTSSTTNPLLVDKVEENVVSFYYIYVFQYLGIHTCFIHR